MSLLVQNFRKKVGACKDKRMSAEKNFDVGYPTGYLAFDFQNGVKVSVSKADTSYTYNSIGIVDGSMISCVGRSGCGKTTFVMQCSGNIIRQYPNSAIIHEDIEGGISDMRKRQLLGMTEEEFEKRYICRNTGITTENFYERVKYLHDIKLENPEDYEYDTGLEDAGGNRIFKLQPTVLILDSLAMLMPEDMADGDELAGPMGAAAIARKNTQLIKRIIPMLKMANIIFFVINHILPDPSLLPKKTQTAWLKQGERVSGGETAIYLANNFLRFDDRNKLSEDKDFGINGILVDILFVKSRTNNAGKVVNMVFDYANGFDPDLSMFLLLSNQGRIHGSGIGMYLGDRNDIKFSKKTFKQKLAENQEFLELYSRECLAALEELINKTSVNVLEEKKFTLDTTSVMLKMMRENQSVA
jgi:energy-coupling factor transporter ATP-binding protein EcfA2